MFDIIDWICAMAFEVFIWSCKIFVLLAVGVTLCIVIWAMFAAVVFAIGGGQ